MNDTTGASAEQQKRDQLVLGLRSLANFIESRTDLPVPNSVRAQHSILIHDVPEYADRIALVTEFAKLLPEARLDYADALRFDLSPYPAEVTYVIHVQPEPDAEVTQ